MKKIFIFLIILFSGYCLFGQDKSDNSLNGGWKLFYGPFDINSPSDPDELMRMNWPSIPAAVPGNVEIDLLSASIIKDPAFGNNIYDLRKFEAYQWWHLRTFMTPVHSKEEHVEIVLEGLDCFGTIWVNGVLIGNIPPVLSARGVILDLRA